MSTLFTNLNLFDGKHDEVKKNAWMLVKDQKVAKVGTGKHPQADRSTDLHGKYVMPGLFNVHTHVTLNPKTATGDGRENPVRLTVRAERHLHQLLQSGVTYVRGCACTDERVDTTLNVLRKEGALKKVPGMMPAGEPMVMTGGHGYGMGGVHAVDSPDEMRKAVRLHFYNGAECTKVMATGGVMSVKDNMFQPQLSVEEMHVAVVESHHKGTICAAHAEANPGIMNALKAGVDSIEHGYYLTDEEVQMMAKNGTYLSPTLAALWDILVHADVLPKWEVHKAQVLSKKAFDSIHRAYKAGVKVVLGTDAGCPFTSFFDTPKELQLLVDKVGMSNFDALSTVRHSAELMKLKDYGTLEPGKYADFLVMDHNPLADVKAVQQKNKEVYQHGVRQF